MALMDQNMVLSSAQAITATAQSTNAYDIANGGTLAVASGAYTSNFIDGNATVFGEDLGLGRGVGTPAIEVFSGSGTPAGATSLDIQLQGAGNASIWMIGWGDSTAYGIYPKGSKGGLVFEDKGDVVPGFDSSQNRFEAFTSMFQWQLGLVVEDWRYTVRLCNIDTTTAGLLGPTPPDLFAILARAVVRLPTAGRTVSGIVKTDAPDKMAPAIRLKMYTDRTVRAALDVQAIRDKNVLLSPTDYAGRPIVNWRNIPIGVQDSMLNTESRVV